MSDAEGLPEEIKQVGGVVPVQDEVTRVNLFRFTSEGLLEATGNTFPLFSRSLPNPLSSSAVQIDSEMANPMLSVGDVIVLDTAPLPGAPPTPYFNKVVLVDVGHRRWPSKVPGDSHVMGFNGPGLAVGKLRGRALNGHRILESSGRLVINAVLDVFNDTETQHDMSEIVLGQTFAPIASIGDAPGAWESFIADSIKKVQAEIRLEKSCRIIGRVVAWFPSHEDMPPILKPKPEVERERGQSHLQDMVKRSGKGKAEKLFSRSVGTNYMWTGTIESGIGNGAGQEKGPRALRLLAG
jgi:hypothetical protein